MPGMRLREDLRHGSNCLGLQHAVCSSKDEARGEILPALSRKTGSSSLHGDGAQMQLGNTDVCDSRKQGRALINNNILQRVSVTSATLYIP